MRSMNSRILSVVSALVVFTFVGQFSSSAADSDDGWISLFNGKDLKGWTAPDGSNPKGWDVADGAIHRAEKGTNLHSVENFLNFELEFEWKVAKGVNSGLKYRFHDGVGPEYQVLDDANATQLGHGNRHVAFCDRIHWTTNDGYIQWDIPRQK